MLQQSGGCGRMAGCSGGRSSCGSRGRTCSRGSPQVPVPYVGGTQLVLYIQGGMQQGQCAPRKMCTNKTKWYVNQNVCFMCGFDVKDWHTSVTRQCKKAGAQGQLYSRKLYAVCPSRVPILQGWDAQEYLPNNMMVGGGESRY
jgi:hypothetical protein